MSEINFNKINQELGEQKEYRSPINVYTVFDVPVPPKEARPKLSKYRDSGQAPDPLDIGPLTSDCPIDIRQPDQSQGAAKILIVVVAVLIIGLFVLLSSIPWK